MKSPRRTTLALSVLAGAALSTLSFGCAGVKNPAGPNGGGGSGGMVVAPPIMGLTSIDISPPSQTILLQANGTALSGSTTYTATGHFDDGHTEDVTARVGWSSGFRSLIISRGMATVTAPGVYTITASSGMVTRDGDADRDASRATSSAPASTRAARARSTARRRGRRRSPIRWTARSSRPT